jgi:hypothetical protein
MGLNSQRVKKIASKLHVLSNTLPNLSIPYVPFPALLSNLIRRRFQVTPAILLIPNGSPLLEEFPPVPSGTFPYT